MLQLFTQTMAALQSKGEVFSREFIQWLRPLVDDLNEVVETASILLDLDALSVLGNPTNAVADASAITAANDAEVLRRSGTTLGFGTVATDGIANNAVTDTKIRDSSALSVIGRASNSSGDPADIATSADSQVLRRSGTTLGFGTVATDGITDAAVTMAKLADLAGLSVIGRATNATGVPAAITGADGNVLRVAGTALGFGTIATAGITDAAVTYAKIQNVAGLSVFGRSANSSGVGADITGTDGQLLRVSGTTLGFGTIATAGIADNAVTDGKIRDSAALTVIGRSANSTGDPADISAGTDGHILRRSGTTLGFGKVLTNFVTGTSTNDSATAGDIGEYTEATASAVGSWSTGTDKNITSISLTAGDWDVEASVRWNSVAITGTQTVASISTTSATLDASYFADLPTVPTAAAGVTLPVIRRRVSIASTTTVYLIGRIVFSAGTPTADGRISARRVR